MKIHKFYLLSLAAIVGLIVTLISFGQPIISNTGRIMLFWNEASGIENSQQLSDWYSLSHFCHGLIFFFFITWIVNKFELIKLKGYEAKLFIAVLIEVLWEVLENSPIIINRYRETGLAAGYSGDSVINSVSDVLFMMFGFWIAKRYGWKVALSLLIILELIALYFIKDNLTLNVIMLIHPVDVINAWQISS